MKKPCILGWILIHLSALTATAQLTTTSNDYRSNQNPGNEIEYATVGSVMPYKVSPCLLGYLPEIMNPSIFKWWLNGNATGYELLKIDGITPLKPLPPPNHVYYPDSAIAIRWIKPGKYTIRVSEKAMFKKGIQTCEQTEVFQTLDVIVADRPYASWNDISDISGCDLDGSKRSIEIKLKGSKHISLLYEVVFTSDDGLTTDTVKAEKVYTPSKNESEFTDTIVVDIPANKYGTYQVFIKEVRDKISQKSGIRSFYADLPDKPLTITALSGQSQKLFAHKSLQVCEDDSFLLKPDIKVESVIWNNGSSNNSIFINRPGYYTAEAALENGCKTRDTVYLSVIPKPVFSLGKDTTLCEDEVLTLDPGIIANAYQWSTGETTPTIQVDAEVGNVWARLEGDNGCVFADTVMISKCKPQSLTSHIPNAFTPNYDNDNDTWRIEFLDPYPNASVTIYNRWGQLVYKTESYPAEGWDGTSNGKQLPMSTYFYVINLKDGTTPIVGSVNLIR